MKTNPPARKLPEHPDLDQLRRQAKELLAAFAAGDAAAVAEVDAHYRDADRAAFALHDAQLVLARSYGFESWPKLKACVDGATAAKLCEAVQAGDITRVGAMLKTRPELARMDLSENNEHRAIHYAVFGRDKEMVRLLMRHGADARKGIYPHRDATRPLTIAAERGYDEIVAVIREEEVRREGDPKGPGAKGAASGESSSDVPAVGPPASTEATTGQGGPERCPTLPASDDLRKAILNEEYFRAMTMLEANPALIHASDHRGWPPLHLAAAMLSEEFVGWLLDHGADPNRRANRGLAALDMLGRSSTADAQRMSTVGGVLLGRGAERTPRWAAMMGETDWLRARHAEGKLANQSGADGLLTSAVRHNRLGTLALLLDLGFDPDERFRVEGLEEVVYSWGLPLQECARLGRLEMAGLLLDRGADPNGEVYAAGTAVSTAYRERDGEMLKLLERYGGVLNAATAGYHRDTGLARRMLEDEDAGRLPKGAVPPASTVAEELLDGECGEPEIIRMALERIDWPRDDPRWYRKLRGPLAFWSHIPWIESEKWRFGRATYLTCFRLILERCHANVSGSFGRSILHDVVAMGRREGVRDWVTDDEVLAFGTALLDAGARLDVRDDLLKSTPLGWACRWGRVKLVKKMLECGADPAEAGTEPWAQPRAWAEKMGYQAVLAELRRHGA